MEKKYGWDGNIDKNIKLPPLYDCHHYYNEYDLNYTKFIFFFIAKKEREKKKTKFKDLRYKLWITQ